MFRRFSVNFAILSAFLDGASTAAALAFAAYLRPSLPAGPAVVPMTEADVPGFMYPGVAILWVVVFFLASVYDPKRIYKVVDEFQAVTLASGFAALVFAGVLYLFFRDFSRWLFLIFVGLELTALLSWRAMARLVFRLGDTTPDGRQVLIVGAGQVGQRVASMIDEYAWTGVRLAGYLDDDPGKMDDDALPVLGTLDQIREVVAAHGIHDVVVACPTAPIGASTSLLSSCTTCR
jgi:FlaA1/EpsC-like NDP-sugar epimerase